MGRRIQLQGQRFGRWLVISPAPSAGRCTFWNCRCDCGKERPVMTQSLRSGLSTSCGCFNREMIAAKPSQRTHGRSKSAEYVVFSGIKRRCENKRDRSYPRYGAKGIKCLFESFEQFLAEVGERPTDEHQIDRIDSCGHYEPGNVRWVTVLEQQRNRRSNLLVQFQGREYCLAELCELRGIPYKRTWYRIRKSGWTVERAVLEGPACS